VDVICPELMHTQTVENMDSVGGLFTVINTVPVKQYFINQQELELLEQDNINQFVQ
jgi:hypothetical protein